MLTLLGKTPVPARGEPVEPEREQGIKETRFSRSPFDKLRLSGYALERGDERSWNITAHYMDMNAKGSELRKTCRLCILNQPCHERHTPPIT